MHSMGALDENRKILDDAEVWRGRKHLIAVVICVVSESFSGLRVIVVPSHDFLLRIPNLPLQHKLSEGGGLFVHRLVDRLYEIEEKTVLVSLLLSDGLPAELAVCGWGGFGERTRVHLTKINSNLSVN